MTGVDTNVLVRYVVADDPEMHERAATFFDSSCSADNPAYLNLVVLVETVWVLKKAYGATKEELIQLLEALSITKQILIQDRDSVHFAITHFKESECEFADCLIVALNNHADCSSTVTFDRNAARLDGAELL